MPGGSILITSAPKSDITVAAAGPAMKLAQSITFRPSKTRSPILSLQAVRLVLTHDSAGAAAGEMRADDEDRSIGEAGQHPLAGLLRRGLVAVRRRRPFRPRDLAGMVHEIAGDQPLLAIGHNGHADMTWRMAWGRHEAHLVTDPVIGLDEIDEPRLQYRRHRVREHDCHVFPLVLARPVLEFDAAHQIARIGKGRDPAAADQRRVPTDMVDMQMRANDRVDCVARITV